MRSSDVQQLFDEFATRFARGEDPDLRELLGRAGDEAPALARLVDSFLAGSPPPEPTPERVELMRAWVRGEPPLVELRVRRGLKRPAVVDGLLERLNLAKSQRKRLAEAYHELETGQLDPARVDDSVWVALRQILKANVRELAGWRPAPIAAAPAYRLQSLERSLESDVSFRQDREPAGDEVDRLFRGTA